MLGSDETAPPPARRAAHARNYWDGERTVSAALKRAGGDPACLASGDADLPVVWDALFDYPPGATAPAACGRTIVRVVPTLR